MQHIYRADDAQGACSQLEFSLYKMAYPTRKIGKGDTSVSAIGFGAMGISAYYGDTEPDEERLKVGVDHWSIMQLYTHGVSLTLRSLTDPIHRC